VVSRRFVGSQAASRHAACAGREKREIDGRAYVLKYPIKGDVALIAAQKADRWGNPEHLRRPGDASMTALTNRKQFDNSGVPA
jgi:acyl CoA:acetate/3-ketoacid CoA transferase alpha subunit